MVGVYAELNGRRAEGADAIGELTMEQWRDEDGRVAARMLSGDDFTVAAEVTWPLWHEEVWTWKWPWQGSKGRRGLYRLHRYQVAVFGSREPRDANGRRTLSYLGHDDLDWTPGADDDLEFVRSENLEHGIFEAMRRLGVDQHDPAVEAAFDDACLAAWYPDSRQAKERAARAAVGTDGDVQA